LLDEVDDDDGGDGAHGGLANFAFTIRLSAYLYWLGKDEQASGAPLLGPALLRALGPPTLHLQARGAAKSKCAALELGGGGSKGGTSKAACLTAGAIQRSGAA
jgi:hypothetical protein